MIYYILSVICLTIILTWALHKRAKWWDRWDDLECVGQPPRSKLTKWWCSIQKHHGHGHYVIESYEGTRKNQCMGCGTIFLEGRQIKVIMERK